MVSALLHIYETSTHRLNFVLQRIKLNTAHLDNETHPPPAAGRATIKGLSGKPIVQTIALIVHSDCFM